MYRLTTCNRCLSIKYEKIIKVPSEHNHVADIIKNEAKLVVEKIKNGTVENIL